MQITVNNLIPSHLTKAIADLRDQIAQTSQEAVTGRYSDLSQTLDGRVGKAMLASQAVEDITTARNSNDIRTVRVDLTEKTLAGIYEAMQGLDTELQSALIREDEYAVGIAGNEARTSLDQVFSALNVRFGNRYLFSGDATATQPFASSEDLMNDIRTIASTSTDVASFNLAVDTYFNDPAGGFRTNIYQGADSASDPDAVLAIDPAIKELISGLAVAALASPSENAPLVKDNPEIVEAAAARLSDGKIDLTNLRGRQGIISENLKRERDALDMEELIVTQNFNTLTARDQYEAATELKQLETNLEASYLLTTRLANLSLLNFMR